jgi:hypothetical protein
MSNATQTPIDDDRAKNSATSDTTSGRPRGATRSDPEAAEKDRKELKKKAEEGLKDAEGKLPADQI